MKKTHGTRYTYISGCRCTDCRKANSTYIAQYRQKRAKLGPETPCRPKRKWRAWEDELAKDYTHTAQQIANMLGRTTAAVTKRRRILTTQH